MNGKTVREKEMTFDSLINRVATKGGITEEGTKIIAEKLPAIVNDMFGKTLEKRKLTTECITPVVKLAHSHL